MATQLSPESSPKSPADVDSPQPPEISKEKRALYLKLIQNIQSNRADWHNISESDLNFLFKHEYFRPRIFHAFNMLYQELLRNSNIPESKVQLIYDKVSNIGLDLPIESKLSSDIYALGAKIYALIGIDKHVDRKRKFHQSPGSPAEKEEGGASKLDTDIADFKRRQQQTKQFMKTMKKKQDTLHAADPQTGQYVNIEEWIQQDPHNIVLYMPKEAKYSAIATHRDRLIQMTLYVECILYDGVFDSKSTLDSSSMDDILDSSSMDAYFKLDSDNALVVQPENISEEQKVYVEFTGKKVWLISRREVVERTKIMKIFDEKDISQSCHRGVYPRTVSELLFRYSNNWDNYVNRYLHDGDAYFQTDTFKEHAQQIIQARNDFFHGLNLTLPDIVSMVKHMDQDFEQAFQLHGEYVDRPLTVYRGLTRSSEELKTYLVNGNILEQKSLMSTTVDKDIAKGFAKEDGVLLQIRVPPYTPFLTLCHSSFYTHEKELLFPKNLHIRIDSMEEHLWTGTLIVPKKYIKKTNPCKLYEEVKLVPYQSSMIKGGEKKNYQTSKTIERLNQYRRLKGGRTHPDVDKFLHYIHTIY